MTTPLSHPLLNQLAAYRQAHPPSLLGTSVQERPIPAWWIGPLDGPMAILVGAFHGDEPEAAELVFRFLTKYHSNPRLNRALVIPVLNPDGLMAQTRTNANGVDLNRNWPTQNWRTCNKEDKYNGGPSPASEPETQWLMALIAEYSPYLILSIHTPYREINVDGPAQPYAEIIAAHNQYPITQDIGYPTPGSFGTYCGKERNMPIITLELPDWEEKRQPFEQTWAENEPALLAVLTTPPIIEGTP